MSTQTAFQPGPQPTTRRSSIIPDDDVPSLAIRWFHALDSPIVDPISLRRAKSLPRSATPPKLRTPSKNWMPFSKRDSEALETAYLQKSTESTRVTVNEDNLFEVDVARRIISPVYWEGPTFEVRRATWFIQSDGFKWIPCEEVLAEQIELGYYKHKPYLVPVEEEDPTADPSEPHGDENANQAALERKKLEQKLLENSVEKQWNLLGGYIGQYIVYTGPNTAWLLYDTTGGKIAKTIITRLTNNQNLGGTRLLRGYPEVEKQSQSTPTHSAPIPHKDDTTSLTDLEESRSRAVKDRLEKDNSLRSRDIPSKDGKCKEKNAAKEDMHREANDYSNEANEEEPRQIDHLIFVVHGIGQRMAERTGQNFVHGKQANKQEINNGYLAGLVDVNMLRQTIKTAFPTAVSTLPGDAPANGIQVLPILWRHEIQFGMASDEEEGKESDLGLPDGDDGPPTLDEITLDGVPNIRMIVSDVLLDIPLYMTHNYREQMAQAITNEINRIYGTFLKHNPGFEERGKVTILGHSLGSLLAFDILITQPMPSSTSLLSKIAENIIGTGDKKISLNFPVQNFFALGSPLGIMLLLRGLKIASRKSLDPGQLPSDQSPTTFCYPAVENLYNIFHKSDPVAYRLEPLIARHYSVKLKPEQIPYIKGGLKSVIDAGFHVGTDIATRAGAMYESFKSGFTSNVFMRGLGLSRPYGSESEINSHNSPHLETSTSEPTDSSRSVKRNSVRLGGNPRSMDSFGAKKMMQLNPSGRVDFCLQEGLLENPYLSALSVHLCYWQDLDVAAFLIRELYKPHSRHAK
ncbi:DDHD domain-containing protein [Phycomyces nitens]|nr:DDHD domain-containing protein [Phycomyces nitens]